VAELVDRSAQLVQGEDWLIGRFEKRIALPLAKQPASMGDDGVGLCKDFLCASVIRTQVSSQAVTDAHGVGAHGVGANSAQPHGLG